MPYGWKIGKEKNNPTQRALPNADYSLKTCCDQINKVVQTMTMEIWIAESIIFLVGIVFVLKKR